MIDWFITVEKIFYMNIWWIYDDNDDDDDNDDVAVVYITIVV